METAQINRYIRVIFALLFFVLSAIALLSEGIFDTGDGILHYQIARWSWKHPELLLHHWGKPVYTLLASPFAQFGYKGVVMFNMLCHLGAAWLTWRIAVRMKLPHATLAPFLVLFTPISWGVWQSGLTEPLFAVTLMSGIYFIVAGRYRTSALLLSLLPFIRTEGYLLLPLFALFFLLRREFFSAFLLSAGSLIYSIAGLIVVHHDFLWIINNNPYTGDSRYGNGPLLYFVKQYEQLFGIAISALIPVGLLSFVLKRKGDQPVSLTMALLISGSFVVYFVAHSLFWWQGAAGSYGLIRVMAAVVPCAVLVSLYGLNQLTKLYSEYKAAVVLTAVSITGFTLYNALDQHGITRERDEKQNIIFSTAEQIKKLRTADCKIYYGYPLITHALDGDPFNYEEFTEMWALESNENFKSGDLVVWDSHFGPLQYNISEQHLLAIPRMKEVYRSEKGTDGNNHYFVICRYE